MPATRSLLILLVLVALAAPLHAWDRHEMITRSAIRSLGWLDEFANIPVTPRADEVPGLQPAYQFPFRGESIGETLPAREILARYSGEPDRGPDQDLNVSWQQTFMGGTAGETSRGYFHMYLPRFTVHVPVPGIEMGAAHKRLVLWHNAARQAFARGDAYWGFRYLACALHYVEDVAQPYHSTQTSRKFWNFAHPIVGTTTITCNYHRVYEGWVSRRMAEEATESVKLGFLAALSGSTAIRQTNLEAYVKEVARVSHREASALFTASLDFYDRRFQKPTDTPPTSADLDQVEPCEPMSRLVKATVPALALTGCSIRGFIEDTVPRMLVLLSAARDRRRQELFNQLHMPLP